jgi:hypothetical protein
LSSPLNSSPFELVSRIATSALSCSFPAREGERGSIGSKLSRSKVPPRENLESHQGVGRRNFALSSIGVNPVLWLIYRKELFRD